MVVLSPVNKIDLGAVWEADPLFVEFYPGVSDTSVSSDVIITNSGIYPVPFKAGSNEPWLLVSSTNGTILPGGKAVIRVTVILSSVVNGTEIKSAAEASGGAVLLSGRFVDYGSCFRPLNVPVVINFPGLSRSRFCLLCSVCALTHHLT